MIRVAVIDDNPKSRKDLVKILGKEPDIRVVAEAATNLAGIREVEEQKPDVILLDNNNPFTDGLEGTEKIVSRFEDTRVIVLAMDSKSTLLPLHSKHTMSASSCQIGACFHLCQDCSTQEILAAIRDGSSTCWKD
jgi:two-component system response regulator DegU